MDLIEVGEESFLDFGEFSDDFAVFGTGAAGFFFPQAGVDGEVLFDGFEDIF